jgi:hypothetical protein
MLVSATFAMVMFQANRPQSTRFIPRNVEEMSLVQQLIRYPALHYYSTCNKAYDSNAEKTD